MGLYEVQGENLYTLGNSKTGYFFFVVRASSSSEAKKMVEKKLNVRRKYISGFKAEKVKENEYEGLPKAKGVY